jgi:pectinesterase
MASELFYHLTILFFVILFFFASLSYADSNSTSAVSPGTICISTPYPSYCKSVLPNQNGDVYDYGRFSFRKSLSQSNRFMNVLDGYLQRQSSLRTTTIRALEDCRLLAGLNVDFLSSSVEHVSKANETLPDSEADDVQTMLSAILTNQQTCLDGLQETAGSDPTVENELSGKRPREGRTVLVLALTIF